MEIKKKISKLFNPPGNLDLSIFFVVLFLIAFGVIMVYSSSFNILLDRQGNVLPLKSQVWMKQLIFGVIGLAVMLGGAFLRTRWLTNAMLFLYPLSLVLLVLVTLKGDENRGAARAFNLGFTTFQPSELTKVAVIIVLAILIERWQNYLSKEKALIYLLLVLAVPVALVAIEDFSTAGVIAVIGGGMIFVSYRKVVQTFLIGGGAGAAIFAYFYFDKGNRATRVATYSSGPWSEAYGVGRQTVQSLLAIGSGGFFGRGLGQSLQKMGQITQAHHDIIFAIICEELGFFGAGLILLLYLGLCYQLLQTAVTAREVRDTLIVLGVMIQIAVQVIMNIGVASNILPNTGMPLPFISYGGSSLVILSLEMALVLGISKKNQYDYMKRLEKYQEKI